MAKTRPKIFLSYAREDESHVKKVYHRLTRNGFEPFFDKKDLFGGDRFGPRIERRIRQSDFFALLLSRHTLARTRFQNAEIQVALKRAEEFPRDDIFIIPLCLDEVDWDVHLPDLQGFNRIDLRVNDWWTHLSNAIREGMKRREDREKQISIEEESAKSLRRLFQSETKSPARLNELIKNLSTLIGAVSVLKADGSWATDRYITFISGLLNSVLDINAEQLRALLTKDCRLKFPKNAAEMADQILAEQMKAMVRNDSYDVISDLLWWRNGQLSSFHKATKSASEKGVSVRRVFNLEWTSSDADVSQLGRTEISKILLQHMEASENWKDRTQTRRYEVRLFERSEQAQKVLKPFKRDVTKAHFGLFRHKSKKRNKPEEVYVRFRVPEYHLQEMILTRQQAAVKEDLTFFEAFWEVSEPLTESSIGQISRRFCGL